MYYASRWEGAVGMVRGSGERIAEPRCTQRKARTAAVTPPGIQGTLARRDRSVHLLGSEQCRLHFCLPCPRISFQAELALHRCRHMFIVPCGFDRPRMRSGCTPGRSVRVRQKHARVLDGAKWGRRAECFSRLQSKGRTDAKRRRHWPEHNGRSCRQPL